ncbi:MAG: cellulose binding domain-containing protein [Micromonosporaceae bacterium]|nr:cellulose binding domain-containing protein [Micromonosporaceae bacterium]
MRQRMRMVNRNHSSRNLQRHSAYRDRQPCRIDVARLSAGRHRSRMQEPAVPRRRTGVELELQMRRLLRVLLAAAALTTIVIGGTAATASIAAAAVSPADCTGTVQVTSFTFDPPEISPGGRSTATLVLQNCTSTAVTAQAIWFGQYSTPGVSGIPAGCPAIDPIVMTANLAPNGTATQTEPYLTFSQCTATHLDAIVNLSAGGTSLGQFKAPLTIDQPTSAPGACQVSYTPNVWPGGFVANVTITNTGTTTINGWTLVFTLPAGQHINNGWNVQIVQPEQTVILTNAPYNATINPGASVLLGFQGTWTTSAASPTAFTLNGVPCTVA